MASPVDAIGLFSGILTTVSFFQSLLPPDPGPQGAEVHIKAGQSPIKNPGGCPSDKGGEISAVYGFNGYGSYIGMSEGGKVDDADYVSFTLDQATPGEQAEYIGIAARKDGVCVSWITVTLHDETRSFAWTGDVGAECGQRWSYGDQRAGDLPNGDWYYPKCTWIDQDHTDGTKSAALKFYGAAYGENVTDTVENSGACDATTWGKDRGPIKASPGPASKRAVYERPQWMRDHLDVSNIKGQTAAELCASETSWGSDFIGADGLFCDMDSKEVSPLCSTEEVEGCIDLSDEDMVVDARKTVAGRRSVGLHREYSSVKHTGMGEDGDEPPRIHRRQDDEKCRLPGVS